MSGDTTGDISCIQIAGDPTKWWLAQLVQASQLTRGPSGYTCMAPIRGVLVLSGKSAGVAVFNEPFSAIPQPLNESGVTIYLPTATGPSAGHLGYELPGSPDPLNIATQITNLMRNSQSQAITLGGAGGTLVLNGATLPFVVVGGPIGIGGSMPHD
jgi:hypothetical protein